MLERAAQLCCSLGTDGLRGELTLIRAPRARQPRRRAGGGGRHLRAVAPTALDRLAEAKGAATLLLAECYVRRDQVALLAFRGRGDTPVIVLMTDGRANVARDPAVIARLIDNTGSALDPAGAALYARLTAIPGTSRRRSG